MTNANAQRMTGTAMINKVLIANRGEIAIRVARTCARLGIASATVHSEADRFGRHVREIGESVELGGAAAAESYLDVEAVVRAAVTVGADAVHPGYGFLAENAAAAAAVEEAGLKWLGPRPDTIDVFGDKAKAKVLALAAGVPVIPGIGGTFTDPVEIAAAVRYVGTPALLKAAAGGGGRGMRLVESFDDLEHTIESAMSEAQRSFGSPELMVERYLVDARHIEVQIAGDGDGDVIHLFERECSLQRRHQKIIEEAPCPSLGDDVRERVLAAACAIGRHVSYRGIGTVELIATGDEFFFLEVNPRIQVEHPVTEAVTGVDLVELQIRIANGGGLGISQEEVTRTGHSFEARIYAEDTENGFLPVAGTVTGLALPTGHGDGTAVRVESSVDAGDTVTSHYDPMIAKLVTWGPDRPTALAGMEAALAETHVAGLSTNLDFLRRLTADPAVLAGEFHTRYVEESDLCPPDQPHPLAGPVAAALWLRSQRAEAPAGIWTRTGAATGWRFPTGAPQATNAPVAVLTHGGVAKELWTFAPESGGATRLAIDDEEFVVELHDTGDGVVLASVSGRSLLLRHEVDAHGVFVSGSGFETRVHVAPFLVAASASAGGSSRNLVAPMTGQVLRVLARVGDAVEEGDVMVVMESMKLELQLQAQHSGTVTAINCVVDSIIDRGVTVVEIEPAG